MKNILTQIQEEFEGNKDIIKYPAIRSIFEKQLKHQFDVYGTAKGMENYQMESFYPEIENNIDKLITKSNLRVIEKVKEMVEEEKSRWNVNGEYYDNVTRALDNLKSELSTLTENK